MTMRTNTKTRQIENNKCNTTHKNQLRISTNAEQNVKAKEQCNATTNAME